MPEDPGYDDLRPVLGPGAQGHVGLGPRAIGPVRGPLPEDGGQASPPDQVGHGLSARLVRRGDGSVCILAVGKMLEAAEEAAGLWPDEGVEATLWDVRVVRPLDPAMVTDAGKHAFVVTVEDGIRNGGAGNFIADAIADLNANRQSPPVLSLGVPTAYIPHSRPDRILGQLGLDGPGIAASIFKAIEWGARADIASEVWLGRRVELGAAWAIGSSGRAAMATVPKRPTSPAGGVRRCRRHGRPGPGRALRGPCHLRLRGWTSPVKHVVRLRHPCRGSWAPPDSRRDPV